MADLYRRLKPIVLGRQDYHKWTGQDKRGEPREEWDVGLDVRERRIMQENMFGPDTGAGLTDGQKRLLDSTLEMGFPQIGTLI